MGERAEQALSIEYVQTEALIPYALNSRTHSEKQVAQIAASIQEFGFTNPVLIDERRTIIAGHGRVLAAQTRQRETVPTITFGGLSEAQRTAYVIADNKLASNAGWDAAVLQTELTRLQELSWDLDVIGFDVDELAQLLEPEQGSGLTDEDDAPPVTETPLTTHGDIWILGNHRLMCGSAPNPEHIEQLTQGDDIDLIHTDPPYGMNAVTRSAVLSKNYDGDILGDNDATVAKDAFALIHSYYPNAKQIWWGANYYCSALPDSECWLVWDKNNGGSDQTDCELAWANFRSVVRQFTQASEKTSRVHPTQKPVSLMEWIIQRFNLSARTIADFFGGSGSTLIAAEKHGINAYIMELDPKYCDVIINRWQDYTGKKATHSETGEGFGGD